MGLRGARPWRPGARVNFEADFLLRAGELLTLVGEGKLKPLIRAVEQSREFLIRAEVQKPIAFVVIGGLITATLLTLVVLPALYKRFSLGEEFTTEEDEPVLTKEEAA